jgi:glycosyltransferase involved in cell wall biosynthesis
VEDASAAQPAPEQAVKNRGKLVLLGALAPSKGVELVIRSFPHIQRAFPWVELVVIGRTPINAHEDGKVFEPYEGRLQALGPAVKLMGALPHREVMRLMPQCGIGLAPYATTASNLSIYADPSRVKDYLACGLPVVITPVPEIAFQVERERAGALVEDDEVSFVGGVSGLLADETLYWEMRQNALRLASGFSWDSIFAEALAPAAATG